MKKTWKQWIAIACVLSMIACMLPAITLAEDGVATPTDLAPIPEEPAGEDPAEEPGEEPGEEPAEEIPGPGIPVLQFGNPGYKGTLKAGVDFTIVLHSDRYANILVTLSLSTKNGQLADADGVKVLFNEKARKLTRVEKEDADSIDLQFEAYIAQDTDYTFVITSPFDANFTLTAANRAAAATEQENEEEEPADEVTGEEPVEEPAEEPEEGNPADEEPAEEEPAGEEPEDAEPAEEESEGKEDGEDEKEAGEDLPNLYFGNSGICGILKAGQEFSLVLHSEHSQNILITLTLTSGAGQAAGNEAIRAFFNGEKKELTQIENDDPESTDVVLQFCAYVEKDNEYTITVAASADVDFFLTAVKRPDPEPEQEEESAPAEENEEPGESEENEESDEAEEIVIEPGETVAIRYWVSGLENDTQPGDTVTLRANADVELDGIPTWQVRNEQVEEGKWKRIGYGDHVTVEVAEGNEYRFVMQDGALSEVLQLHITKDETAEETTEETEETGEREENEETEETEKTEEIEQPDEVNEDGEPEEPEIAEEDTENNDPSGEPEESVEEPEEQETTEESEEELPEEEPTEEEPEEESEEEGLPEEEEKPERHITVDVLWDVPDPVIGDTAHFVAVLEGYEELQYTIQWQYSPDEEIWFDIPYATEPTMDVVVTEENNEVFWRILVFVEDGQEI